jgi:hypothetical protein
MDDTPDVPAHGHGLAYALVAVFLAALAFGAWGLWTTFGPRPQDARSVIATQGARIEALEQRVALLARSEQVSRDANRELQGTLADRDEEIAGLRADVAFYERFVGSTAQRHGLSVHQLQLQAQEGGAWHFTATLTQNLNRGATNSGQVTLSIEGTRAGKLRKLAWADLRQQPSAPGVAYSFKYFQQLEGDILLPPGLQPIRVTVHVQPARGPGVERAFTWDEATAPAPSRG